MSFLKKYAEENSLPPLRKGAKKKLEEVEKKLDALTQGDDTFSDIVQDYADRITNIVERIKAEFGDWKLSIGNLVSSFRFIIDIASEVAQIIAEIEPKIVPPNATPDEARQAKVLFGQELTYFIYMLWDPRLVKWMPLWMESWLEKKIIYLLAGMSVDWALERFKANPVVAAPQAAPKKKKRRK